MITASAAFLALEAAAQGGLAIPIYLAAISPWLLPTGVADGTFTDCVYVAPEKIQVNGDTLTAVWESDDLESDFEYYPRSWPVTWTPELTGYYISAAQYKTADSQAALAAAAYQTMGPGDTLSLYRWYKLKVTFTGYNSLATDSGTPDRQAQASDSGTGLGVAIDGTGEASYVDLLRLTGDHLVKKANIESCGEITLQEPRDFEDLVSGDHTLRVMDPDGLYNPDSTDFIYYGQDWYGRTIKVLFGYQTPGTGQVEFLTDPLFEGKVINWSVTEPSENGVPRAEIYARDWMAELLKTPLGKPDSDGNPAPVLHGTVLKEAQRAYDIYPAAPAGQQNFEKGSLKNIPYEELGGGSVTLNSATPMFGSYSCVTAVDGANQTARLRFFPAYPSSSEFLIRGGLRINSMPDPPGDKLTTIMSLAGDNFKVAVDADTRLHVYYAAAWHETDTYIGAYVGVRIRFALGLLAANPGYFRFMWQGDEILGESEDLSSLTAATAGAWLGPVTGGTAEIWEIEWDNEEHWPNFAPLLYRIPGYPFLAMETVYQDGLKINTSIPRASRVASAEYLTNMNYGTIEFPWADWSANPPRESIMARVKKDEIVHPVDDCQSLINLLGLGSRVNAASFAAAKAEFPNDRVGCDFEDTTYGAALRALVSSCLLFLAMDRGQFFCRAYTGDPPTGPVLDLTETLVKGAEDESWPFTMDEIIAKVTAKWGWERNSDLYYEAVDADIQAQVGEERQEDLDLTWGQPVASDTDLARQKADIWLKRLKGCLQTVECTAFLKAMRLELGDVVSRRGINYRIGRKQLDGGSGVGLTLERYAGED
jgi:hypothetical protein